MRRGSATARSSYHLTHHNTPDMLAPLFPRYFLHLICLASVCKSLCGIAAGSANGAIVEHFSRRNNLAEVMAKVRREKGSELVCVR